jgi:hypothetical protein
MFIFVCFVWNRLILEVLEIEIERATEGKSSLWIVEHVIMEHYLGDQTVGRTILKCLNGNMW